MRHPWKFFRAGGFDQVRLTSGEDLLALDKLDQKLWVALSCPTSGLEFDQKTLEAVDLDKDGRIRAPEIIAATKWVGGLLKDPDDLLKGAPTLPLDAIDDSKEDGKQLVALARRILDDLGKKEAVEISPDDTADNKKILEQMRLNGDGIVPPETAEDPAVAQAIKDIMECLGGEADRSGKQGVGQAKVDQFFTDAQAFSDWWKKAEDEKDIVPLGEGTAAAIELVKGLRPKVEDYFARCRLVAFDERAEKALNRSEEDYLAMAAKDLDLSAAEISALPLARVAAAKPLPLLEGVNPAFADRLARLHAEVVKPLLCDLLELAESQWKALLAKLAAHEGWLAAKAGATVEKLGLARVRELLAGDAEDKIGELIEQDLAVAPEADAIAALDRLVRLHRDLFTLLNNFVSFREFYGRKNKAIFQAGTLFLDQRSCDLCIRVEDAGKHSAVATLGQTYLAYCDLVRKSTGEKMTVAAAFTGGDSDNLMVGRNGIFYDRKGNDWDATITKIVEHPISIRQAFWSPYKKVLRFAEAQVAKFAASKEKEAETATQAGVTGAAATAQAPKPPEAKSFDIAKFAGIFAAIGLAIGAIGGALGAMVAAFASLAWWQMPLALAGIMLVISGPSMLIAWLKLRQRNLGPLLDANGWAINAKAKINIPFGTALTGVAKLPAGSSRDLVDPFAEKHGGRNWTIAICAFLAVVLGLWYFGVFNLAIPSLPRSSFVESREKAEAEKAAKAAPPAPTPAPAPAK